MSSSEMQGGWVLDISFPRPYSGVDVQVSASGYLVITIPFESEESANAARSEMEVSVVSGYRIIPGEVVKGEQA